MKTAAFTEYKRVVALDVLRGIAILGTLLTNIVIFAIPESQESAMVAVRDSLVWTIHGLITDGKFIGLLTIMFGIGLEIQRQSAIRKGLPWPGTYPLRVGLLILDGVLNFVFIFEFDVLMGYGMTALVIAAVTSRSPRVQRIWMWAALVVHVLLMIVVGVLAYVYREQTRPESLGLEAYDHSSYWGDVLFRVQNFFLMRLEIPFILLMGAALYLVGVHLYRAGIFAPEGARLRKIIMCLSFGIGLPLDWGLRLLSSPGTTGVVTRYVTSPCVSIGLLAAVAAFYVRRDRLGWLGRVMSDVGRMALTCYLAQNLIAGFVFYDYGLGMARIIRGPWSELYVLALYALIAAFLVVMSRLWLRFFPRGPVELLWHWSYAALSSRYLAWRASRSGAPHDGKNTKKSVVAG